MPSCRVACEDIDDSLHDNVTSQISNLECYTLDHHCISYFILLLVDPRNSTQLKDPRRELGISRFSYLNFIKY